jgi:hypothetical protein
MAIAAQVYTRKYKLGYIIRCSPLPTGARLRLILLRSPLSIVYRTLNIVVLDAVVRVVLGYSIVVRSNLGLFDALEEFALRLVISDDALVDRASGVAAAVFRSKPLYIDVAVLLANAELAIAGLLPISIVIRRLEALKHSAFDKRY